MNVSLTGIEIFLILTATLIGCFFLIVIVLNICVAMGGTGMPFEQRPVPPAVKSEKQDVAGTLGNNTVK